MLFLKKIKLIMMTRRWRSIWKNNILHEIHQKYIYIWKHSHIITTECWQSHTTKMNIRKLGRTKKKKNEGGTGDRVLGQDLQCSLGFPGGSDGNEPSCQCRRNRFNP